MVACGALASHVQAIAARRGWPVAVHGLAPLLHNRPDRIAIAVEDMVRPLIARGERVAVAYADCGTYGALDEVCERLGVARLRGPHCYAVFAGRAYQDLMDEEPGTYVLTDFLVRSYAQTIVAQLGLDRHPELREDYFRHYRRAVWLVQERDPSPELHTAARSAAAALGLPLTVVRTGDEGLETELEALLSGGLSRG